MFMKEEKDVDSHTQYHYPYHSGHCVYRNGDLVQTVGNNLRRLPAGRKKCSFWLMAAAYLGGYVGGASVSGYVGYGFNGGISQMWTSMFVVGGITIFIMLFARRLNYFGRKTGAVTLADFVCTRYGEGLRLPMAIFSVPRPAF